MADETRNIPVCHRAHRHWCTVVFGGALIDRSPYAELCNAAYALVKRQIPDDAVRRKGECLVTGSGTLHTVRWAYSTATSREREMPPVAYETKVAFDGKTYHLCSLSSLNQKQEFHHPLCGTHPWSVP